MTPILIAALGYLGGFMVGRTHPAPFFADHIMRCVIALNYHDQKGGRERVFNDYWCLNPVDTKTGLPIEWTKKQEHEMLCILNTPGGPKDCGVSKTPSDSGSLKAWKTAGYRVIVQ